MFKVLYILLSAFLIVPKLKSQSLSGNNFGSLKKELDFTAIDKWPSILPPKINDNGSYAGYLIRYPKTHVNILHLKSLTTFRELYIDSVLNFEFSPDNKHIIYKTINDQLVVMSLDGVIVNKISNVNDFSFLDVNNRKIFLHTTKNGKLTLQDIYGLRSAMLDNVLTYRLTDFGRELFFVSKYNGMQNIARFDVNTFLCTTICSDTNIGNYVLSKDNRKYAYISGENEQSKEIKFGDTNVPDAIFSFTLNADFSKFNIIRIIGFNNDGHSIFFEYKGLRKTNKASMPQLNIWNYLDIKLQFQEINEPIEELGTGCLNLVTGKLEWIQDPGIKLELINDTLAISTTISGYPGEKNWNVSSSEEYNLVNLKSHDKKKILLRPFSISPDQQYIICVDTGISFINLTAYNIQMGGYIPLTHHLYPEGKTFDAFDMDDRRRMTFYGWNIRHELIFLDDFDIWQVDLKNPHEIRCLTKGYGRKHHIVFRPAIRAESYENVFNHDNLLLTAFDLKTKRNCFFLLNNKKDEIQRLSFQSYYFTHDNPAFPYMPPVKAKNADTWIVSRQSAKESINYFVTRDFKNFQSISNFHPEIDYNYLDASLVNFSSLSGARLQGILYKPGNFDNSKRYPVIMNFYENMSNKIYLFHNPDYSIDNINIPYFVSRGYIVFTPDIVPLKAKVAKVAYEAISGAANYLASLSFVDSTKIGVQGHSFGGLELYAILTNTNRFTAGVCAAGHSDVISASGSVNLSGFPYGREFVELAQGRIGYSLWERSKLYVENSPIFFAHHIRTPLLILNNKQDESTNFSQGVEMFLALRKLRRQVWMLQYENEGHSLVKKQNKVDYTIKLSQYFDFYLKNAPIPSWMSY
jgi:dienelactone hydrolase